jgi:hypothetical protein
MTTAGEIQETMGEDWLPAIYADEVRTIRTRSCSIDVPERENAADIMHTLLGIELKVGRRRFACPDLSTARYMQVFARIGCREFAIPYDITKISTLADRLETAWQRSLLVLEAQSPTPANRLRGGLLREIRAQLTAIGPGEKMPHFHQSTKQRPD